MSLPPAIDLSPLFEELGLPRRAQGKRPTCSVFTVAHALDFALACRTGSGEPQSVEFLNWAAKQGNDRTDDGGFFSEIWSGYEAFGCCPESRLPYRSEYDPLFQPDDTSHAHTAKTPLRLEWIKEWDPETGVTAEQSERIRSVLADGRPVMGGLRWPHAPVWSNGVLAVCPPEAVFDGHSVLLVGYRTDPALPGGGGFLIRNSNDPESGILPFAYVSEYLNDAAWLAAP